MEQDTIETKRKKLKPAASPLSLGELQILHAAFAADYHKYNARGEGGSRTGLTPRQELIKQLTTIVAQESGCELRTEAQIGERLRYDLKKVRNKISAENQSRKTGGGSLPPVPPIPDYLFSLEAIMRKEESTTGITGGKEINDNVIIVEEPVLDYGLENNEIGEETEFVGRIQYKPSRVKMEAGIHEQPRKFSQPRKRLFEKRATLLQYQQSIRSQILKAELDASLKKLENELLKRKLLEEQLKTEEMKQQLLHKLLNDGNVHEVRHEYFAFDRSGQFDQ